MKETTKVAIHYIINASVVLITIAALVVGHTLKAGVSGSWENWLPFLAILIVSALSLTITSLILGKDKEKPYKVALPIVITTLLVSLTGMLLLMPYYDFFTANSYWSAFSESPWGSIGMILYAIPIFIIITFIMVLGSKLSLISLSKDIATEWTIKNAYSLIWNKAEIVHSKDFSYLIGKDKMMIIRFITEEKNERLVVFEADERNIKNSLVNSLEEKVVEFNELNSTVSSAIVYLSNHLPNTKGTSNFTKVIKNRELFNTFKQLEGKGRINSEEINGRLS